MPGTRESAATAPDTLGQVRRALRNIFRRNKKPKASIASLETHYPASSRAQTSHSTRLNTPKPQPPPATTQEPDQPTDNVEDRPSPISEGQPRPQPQPVRDASSTLRIVSSPGELSSSPKSPVTPANPEVVHSTEEQHSTDPEDEAAAEPEPIQSHNQAPDEEKPHKPSQDVEHTPDLLHPHEGPLVKASTSLRKPVIFRTLHTDTSTEDTTPEPIDSASPDEKIEKGNEIEPQTKDSETELSFKHQSVATVGDSPAQQEEPKQANASNRRAPAMYHDEKIPVLAEPPPVRTRAPAPGMVATSGPLEDFPFR